MNLIGTKPIATQRLLLRRFQREDAEAMFRNWASDPEVTRFLTWPPHASADVTRGLIGLWVNQYDLDSTFNWVIEYERQPIGSISFVEIQPASGLVEVGYCIGKPWWGKGIVTEACGAVMEYAFLQMDAHKFIGRHDILNPASGRIMEKLGMKLEGIAKSHYLRRDGTYADIVYRAIIQDEWEMNRYTSFPCDTSAFREYPGPGCRADGSCADTIAPDVSTDFPALTDGEIELRLYKALPERPETGYVPEYHFDIWYQGKKAGETVLRLGYARSLFYGGNIGYNVDPDFRGRGIAGRAARLLLPVLRRHGMPAAFIVNAEDNASSRRVCEKLGLRHVGLYEVPEELEMRRLRGVCRVNIYEMRAE